MEHFPYMKLDPDHVEIRLVLIQPAPDFDDPIHLDLFHRRLEDKPDYYTVSYTWDAPFKGLDPEWDDVNFKLPITVNGHMFLIRKNLDSAIRHFRQIWRSDPVLKGDLVLWIDAVCINQEDLEERSHEVLHMGRIYSSCRAALIWLGPEDEESVIAMEKVWIAGHALVDGNNVEKRTHLGNITAPNRRAHSNMGAYQPDHIYLENIGYVQTLLRRSWFNRAWTMQESVLPPRAVVFCGHFWVPSACFLAFADWCSRILNKARRQSKDLEFHALMTATRLFCLFVVHQDLIKEYQGSTESLYDLKTLLKLLRQRECKDPKDKVYAALGMCPRSHSIVPDYTKNTRDVFTQAARAIIESENEITILESCYPTSRIPDLPSWAPDWTADPDSRPNPFRKEDIRTGPGGKMRRSRLYNASLNGSLVFAFQDDPGTLVVQVLYVDVASHVSPFESRVSNWNILEDSEAKNSGTRKVENAWQDVLRCFDEWLSICLSGHTPKSQNLGILGSISGNINYTPKNEPVVQAVLRALCADLCSSTVGGSVRRMKDGKDILSNGIDNFYYNMYKNACNRSFIASAKGLIGMGPVWTQKDDLICIVSGHDMPLLLRPRGDDTYRFAGGCYIHGIMDGEFCKETKQAFQTVRIV